MGELSVLDEVREAIAAAGVDTGPEELADILWLARCMGAPPAAPALGPVPSQPPTLTTAGAPPPPPAPPAPTELAAPPPRGIPLFPAPSHADISDAPRQRPTMRPAARRSGEYVRVRRAAPLDDPLALMRALRPLGRRRLPGNRPELDEEATVMASIGHRTLFPVLRPAKERWLDLTVVVDAHSSMLLWHDLVRQWHRALVQTGLFRTTQLWYLHTDTEDVALSRTPYGRRVPASALARPRENGLVLLLSDAVSAAWDGRGLHQALRTWAMHSVVALLDLLPQRLWAQSTIETAPHWIRAPGPAAPNVSWSASAASDRARRHRTDRHIALPVLDLSPHALAELARLVSGDGRRRHLPCLLLSDAPRPTAPERGEAPRAFQAVQRFQHSASPDARQLAGYLSAVPLTLPVMNLVRRVMLPGGDHGHLAEVALGGLFEPWEVTARTDPARTLFHFRPGVREALLGAQLRRDVTAVQEIVRQEISAFLRQSPGSGGDFLALRLIEDEPAAQPIPPESDAFAYSPPVSARPGGRAYQLILNALLEQIGSGALRPGDRLPTQRQLAEEFGVSRDTVQRALRELANQGYIEIRQGSGTRVTSVPLRNPGIDPEPAPAQEPIEADLAHELVEAFASRVVTIDVVAPTLSPFLSALAPRLDDIRRGASRPSSLRIRVLLTVDPSDDLNTATRIRAQELRAQLERIRPLVPDIHFEVRPLPSHPLTVLYHLNDDRGLTSLFVTPDDLPDLSLFTQPPTELAETQAWFASWWDMLTEDTPDPPADQPS
ncbi:SAV_2336 N-terminal domain-related protein [Streptomyces sp. NPDC051576]|uniref:SAV_2336 N-terminal domain-related protein n=1 Tax=Streptomyces sp. NPDC051576 TaxID=3155803 RepID=UPI00342E4823